MPFLDTNILLRHLLNDHPVLSARCKALIQAIEQGDQTVWTTNLVIAEVVFVLQNKRTYSVAREQIRDLLLPIISLPGIKMENKRLYTRAFELFTTLPIDFIDCYHAALIQSRRDQDMFSLDSDFDKVHGIARRVP